MIPDWPPTSQSAGGMSLNVLIVEDEPIVSFDIAATVRDFGHCATEVANARSALEILSARNDIDLVMTDFGLPDRVGSELAAEIIRRWPSVVVILVTGYTKLPSGFASELPRLSKPVTSAQLAPLLEQLVPMARLRRERADT